MDTNNLIEAMARWAHVGAGAAWIGLLFFFAWVMPGFLSSVEAATRKQALPELMPRALWWARWATAWTWVTGVVLLVLVFYKSKHMLFEMEALGDEGKMPGAAHGILAGVFLVTLVYDFVAKKLTDNRAMFALGLIFTTGFPFAMSGPAGMTFRGYMIHIGAMFGTIMAWNVWVRIWPAQKKVLTAIRAGEAPDPALVAMAGARLKHNTYLAVPILFFMIAQHGTWAASNLVVAKELNVGLVVLVGWVACWLLYRKSAQVEGIEG